MAKKFSAEQKLKRAEYLRAWKAANPDKVSAASRASYQKHRESRLLRSKNSWAKDLQTSRLKHRVRRANRPDTLAAEAAWRAANRQAIRARARARHVRKRKNIIEYLSELQRGRCAYCREMVTGAKHIDHIMPKALGGSNDRSNLQLPCSTCNFSKNAKHPIEFARSLGRLL